jgi:glycine hydroxymethyltransferase
MTDIAHISGLIAAKVIPSPVPYAHFVTSSLYKTMRGPRGGFILAKKEFGHALNQAVFPGSQSAILVANMAAKAVAFKTAMTPEFQQLSRQVVKNAQALAQGMQSQGFRIVSGGTDNHLMLVDLRSIKIKGNEAQITLEKAGINVNMNLLPFDTEKPFVTSGIRLGTPLVTSRGMKEEEMSIIAQLIGRVLHNLGDTKVIAPTKEQAAELCRRFPIPGYDSL